MTVWQRHGLALWPPELEIPHAASLPHYCVFPVSHHLKTTALEIWGQRGVCGPTHSGALGGADYTVGLRNRSDQELAAEELIRHRLGDWIEHVVSELL